MTERAAFLAKAWVKERLVPDVRRERVVWFGPGRGVRLFLTRQSEWQKEIGLYEAEVLPVYRQWIHAGSVVYDVGTGYGETTLLFARMAHPGGLVVGFEPCADNIGRFWRNVGLNARIASIRLIEIYVGDDSRDGSPGQTALDEVAAREPAPTLVKIDVDGAEDQVLDGMRGLLRSVRPVVVVETHSRDLERRCQEVLGAAGYGVTIVPHAWWRRVLFLTDRDPSLHNRWLVGVPVAIRNAQVS